MTRISIPFAVVVLLFTVWGCSKQSGPANVPSVQQNNKLDTLVHMGAKINGVSWLTDSVYSNFITRPSDDSGVHDLEVTSVNRNGGDVSSINFHISNYTGVGTYIVNPPLVSVTYYNAQGRHFATSGQITVASDTLYAIIGTFNFTADTVIVTQGEFNVQSP